MPPSWSSALGGRLLVGPHALLEGAAKLGVVGFANQVVALVVERRVEEELLVLELEVLVLFPDPALAHGHELLSLGQRAHCHGPLFKGDRHLKSLERRLCLGGGLWIDRRPIWALPALDPPGARSLGQILENAKFVTIVATARIRGAGSTLIGMAP